MLNPRIYEYDCTRKCRLRRHGNRITSALTKRSVDDEKLAAFVAKSCCNYVDILDDLGRSAVHVAASVGRYAILEWLLNQGAIINSRDYESGSSALHRAIFYGCIDCAVLLMRYGASPSLLDEDTRSALQQVCRLCDFPDKASVPANNELLVWGSNRNYNLGVGNDQGAEQLPQMLDFFRKEQISIQSVALGAYHSLFLDKKGHVYAVGHGKGGRLGINTENSLTTPKRLKLPLKNAGEEVICISVSRKHSLVLTDRSLVFACGLNEDKQLGVRDAGEKLLVYREVVTLRDYGVEGLVRVIACDYHSLAYSEHCIYVWGSNHGQMGLEAGIKTVPLPKMMKLPPRTKIQFVEANNTATVVLTKDNVILLFHKHKMKVIKPPNYETLKSISVIEGDNTKLEKGSASALKLLMLTQTNVVFLWYQLTQCFYRCSFTRIRLTQIDKILYRANQVLILSQGDVYRGKCQQVSVPSYYHSDKTAKKDMNNLWSSQRDQRAAEMSQDFMIRVELERLANIDRCVDIFCDEDFASFAVLQESHMKYFKLPTLTPEEYSFKKLYNEVNEYDTIHDIVFHVDGEVFPAHRLIVYARAPGLRETIAAYIDKDVYLKDDPLLSGKMFELMLKFMYTNYLPNEQDLEDIQRSLHPENLSLVDVCQVFLGFVEKFQLNSLANYLRHYVGQDPFYLPNLPEKSKYRFGRLRHSDFPELYDVRIVCADEVVLPAHKCILVARLEYFEMMFTHTWAEQSTINLSTIPADYMRTIVEFLYSADVEHFRKQQHRETFLYNMIVFCDQFFIERLRKVCEILILDKISIRKCGEMLDFACMYNCEVLKRGCMAFICQNLARVLSQKSLDNCDPESLKCINPFYREMFKEVFDYRMITPDSEAVDDECLLSFVDDFEVDLDYRMDEEEALSRSVSKAKTKESKSKQFLRQYEREAITSMMATQRLSEDSQSQTPPRTLKESQEIADKLQTEAKGWMKVVVKKEQKKRASLDLALKVHEVLKTEEKPKETLVPLTTKSSEGAIPKAKTPEGPEAATTPSSATRAYHINLADFQTPSREKLSQKQRKRLLSENSATTTSWRCTSLEEDKPMAVSPPSPLAPNAWGILPQSPTTSLGSDVMVLGSPPAGSWGDPTSFANIMRSGGGSGGGGGTNVCSPGASSNSFSQILAEERRQREYYERMRNKSLVLTQIEEQAIAELREFYNVDNISDEVITIERKPPPATINFAVWHHN